MMNTDKKTTKHILRYDYPQKIKSGLEQGLDLIDVLKELRGSRPIMPIGIDTHKSRKRLQKWDREQVIIDLLEEKICTAHDLVFEITDHNAEILLKKASETANKQGQNSYAPEDLTKLNVKIQAKDPALKYLKR